MLVHVSITCTQLIVRLGRALEPEEHHVKLHILTINEPRIFRSQFSVCKFMMESIVAKGTTVLEFKQQIAEEAREQGIDFDPNVYELCDCNNDHDEQILSDTG